MAVEQSTGRANSSKTTNNKRLKKEPSLLMAKMALHNQRVMIHELSVSRSKLEEENQALRDASDSPFESQVGLSRHHPNAAAGGDEASSPIRNPRYGTSKQSTVKKGIRGDVFRALDKMKQGMRRDKAPRQRESRREVFKNPLFSNDTMFRPSRGGVHHNPELQRQAPTQPALVAPESTRGR
eukprot:CAMPEP_0168790860 /NCGR_PEP_ID=MMETSP0725-20121227/13647_1 /TAXON_ID=265536 /ORGANISM="Amphiprora sp., Strain CCMP467" /LENGTH=181 /DNA_ID=CAMNT_0008841337 /DNA_START=38 /DNA_END=584 /DNA_ORIENTATION=+